MTREEALQRIVDNNFAGEYGFDMQILIDCMVVAREIILNSQFPSEDCISRAEAINALGYDISIESDRGLDEYKSVIKEMLCKIYDVQKANIEKLPSVTPKPKTDVIDKIRAEIDRQQKWLLQAGYTAYNVDIAFDAMKAVVAESEDKE